METIKLFFRDKLLRDLVFEIITGSLSVLLLLSLFFIPEELVVRHLLLAFFLLFLAVSSEVTRKLNELNERREE